jgi:hypothetical protein
MTTRRPRVTCPACGRDVALTEHSGRIGRHFDQTGRSHGYYCDAVGTLPGPAVHQAELRQLAELIFRHPQRARELIAQLPDTDPHL